MDHSENFLTLEQIEKLIELPVSNIREMLIPFVYFKGLVYGHEHKVIYLDGYYIIEQTELDYAIYNREDLECLENLDRDVRESIISIKGCEFSNNCDLIDVEVSLKSSLEIDVILYSYKQLCEIMKNIGAPDPKSINELSKKEYAYDIELVNQKSNFSLSDASKIAANVYKTSIRSNLQQQYMPNTIALIEHYLELLSDCIKGTNQHGFKLHTVELWCFEDDKYGESASYSYDNGTYLNQKATLDSKLTIISKREFVRWCEYENVDTGLYYHQKDTDESVEALLLKNEKLKKQIDEQNMEIIDLKWIESPKGKSDYSFPPELQLSIDAFEQLCLGQKTLPTNEKIKEWLTKESKERGITHKDGSTELKGLSDVKLKTIPSIIKS